MDNTFADNRGTIKDLLQGEDYSATHITFVKGAVRGNHYHKETTQYDIVLKGELTLKSSWVDNDGNRLTKIQTLKKGDYVVIYTNTWHAYLANEDTEMLSTCFGKRVGTNYESDTIRLSAEQKLL